MPLFLSGCRDDSSVHTIQSPSQQSGGGSSDIDNAISSLREIVKKEPDNLNAWIKLGNILMDTNRFKEAIPAFEKALELDPLNVNVRVDMGTCYRNSGSSEKAAEAYKQALRYNANHLFAHKNLGVVLAYDLGMIKEGLSELETYLSLSPNASDSQEVKKAIQELRDRI
jgi:Flp pilus assembly protein TadD